MSQVHLEGKERYPHLFAPLRIGNLRLKNRIIAAPTSPSMISTEGHMTPELIAYLGERARGGAAVVTYGEAIVHSRTGKSHNKQLQLDSFGVRQRLTEAANVIHAGGAYANIQLSHGGKYGGLASVGGDQDTCTKAYGAGHEITPQGEVFEMPTEMVYEIIEAFGKSAKLVKECGFDMVMVHAAHGWLFSQFLSPVLNKRTDEFGGSLANRARFLILALEAVRKAVGPCFPIEVRLSGDDLTETGLHMEDCIKVAKMIEDKVDLYNISCGNHEDPDMFCRTHPSAFYKRGVNVYLAAEIKKHVSKPVACVGSLNDPKQMEEIIATGQADIVELARALVADPFLPDKTLHGREEDITPCLRCYECFGETVTGEGIKCTVNPLMGKQLWFEERLTPAENVKRVLVVGGGPAGMEAAIIAARRGHQVTLVEKRAELGGNLFPAGASFFKQDIAWFRKVLVRQVSEAGVKVITGTTVDTDYVREADPDVLVVAIGANELVPPIEGIHNDNVIMAIEAEMHPEKLGHRVILMGGGLVGSEAAVSLHHEGHECTIVEMKPEVAGEVNPFYRGGLMPEIEKAASIYTDTKVKKIVDTGVVCEKDGKEFLLEGDSVVCALGFRAPYDQVDALCDCVEESYVLGDCKNVGLIYHAMRDAYFTACQL